MSEPRPGLAERLARPSLVAPALLVASAASSWWLADRLLPGPDEGASLTAAAKILDGAVFYRDVDAYPFPGAPYLLAAAMSALGEQLWVARALAGASFSAMVLASYGAALALMERRRAALFGAALLTLKFLAFPNYTMFLYQDLAQATAMGAVAALLRHAAVGGTGLLAVAGLLAGLTVVFKQNIGIYLGAAGVGLLLWPGLVAHPGRAFAPERWREAASFVAGAALPVGAMAAYFAAHGVFGAMVFSGLVRPFTGYLPASGVSALPPLAWWQLGELVWPRDSPYLVLLYGHLLENRMLPGPQRAWGLAGELVARLVYTGMPVAFAGVAWLRWRAGRGPAGDARGRLLLAGALALAITLSAFPRADISHVLTVYPAVLLVLFALPAARGGGTPAPPSRAFAAVVLAFVVAIAALTAHHDTLLTRRLELDRARLWVRPQDAWVGSLVPAVRERVPPGEPFFVYGHEAQLYFLTDRYFPWPFSQLYPGMAGGDQGRHIARLLAERRPRLIVQGVTHWPGMTTLTRYTPAVQATIERAYHRVTDEILRERPPDGPAPPEFVLRVWERRDAARAPSGR